MRSRILTAVTALIVLSGCASLQGHEPASPGTVGPAHVTQTLKSFTDTGKLVGAFGYADREAGRVMARDTVVSIYSTTIRDRAADDSQPTRSVRLAAQMTT